MKALRWTLRALLVPVLLVWFARTAATLAFANLERARVGQLLALVYVVWIVVALSFLRPRKRGLILALASSLLVALVYFLTFPSNEREWLPAPGQTGMLGGGIDIDETVLQGWNAFLDEFGAILKGEKLVAHWRFRQGINLRRMFLEPRTFDAVLLAQGSAAVPYLEDGPLSDSQSWERILQLFGGNFFTYFIWIN